MLVGNWRFVTCLQLLLFGCLGCQSVHKVADVPSVLATNVDAAQEKDAEESIRYAIHPPSDSKLALAPGVDFIFSQTFNPQPQLPEGAMLAISVTLLDEDTGSDLPKTAAIMEEAPSIVIMYAVPPKIGTPTVVILDGETELVVRPVESGRKTFSLVREGDKLVCYLLEWDGDTPGELRSLAFIGINEPRKIASSYAVCSSFHFIGKFAIDNTVLAPERPKAPNAFPAKPLVIASR